MLECDPNGKHVYIKRLALSVAVPFSLLLQIESSRSLLRKIRQLSGSALIKLFRIRYFGVAPKAIVPEVDTVLKSYLGLLPGR